LEEDLGVALFNRTTRRLRLTEAGNTFHAHAAHVLAGLQEARAEAASFNQAPRGLLRLNVPTAFGRLHVVPHLPGFLSAYPEIRLDLTLNDTTVDLIEVGADLAIRIGALADSSLDRPRSRTLYLGRSSAETGGRFKGESIPGFPAKALWQSPVLGRGAFAPSG
jgi:DNA-binding transcriptional LysR family regulator